MYFADGDAVQEGELLYTLATDRQRMTLKRQPVESCPFRASSRQTRSRHHHRRNTLIAERRLPPHHTGTASTRALGCAPRTEPCDTAGVGVDRGLASLSRRATADRCPCSQRGARRPVRTVVDQNADESYSPATAPHDHQRRRRIGCRYADQPLRCNALDDHSVCGRPAAVR